MTDKLEIRNITDWSQVPGTNTYFTSSDVRPYVTGKSLNIYNSRGISRSWGTPSVRSDMVYLAEDVIKITVTGWHKHTISPVGGNYYFVYEGGEWTRRTANYGRVKAVLAQSDGNEDYTIFDPEAPELNLSKVLQS